MRYLRTLRFWSGILPLTCGLIFWFLLSDPAREQFILPSPLAVASEFFHPLFWVAMLRPAFNTFEVVGSSVCCGVVLGYALGLAIGMLEPTLDAWEYFLNGLKSTPVTILLPLFLCLFGLGHFMVPLITLPIIAVMAVNIAASVRLTSRNRRDTLKGYGISGWHYIRRVLIHELNGEVFSTLRFLIPFAFAVEIAIDYFLGIDKGFGAHASAAYQYPGREAELYATILLVAGLGAGAVKVIDLIAERVLAWRRGI